MQRSRGRDAFFNFIAVVMVGFTILAIIAFVLIFMNPNADFNPFPPVVGTDVGDLPTPFEIPTSTATPDLPTLPPTWTPSATGTTEPTVTASATTTLTPTATVTGTKVFTPTTTGTATLPGPTATLTPTFSPFEYVVQSGSPTYTSYFAGPNPNTLCDWAGLAGQVFDTNGFGKLGAIVHVFGSGIDEKVTSGTFASDYGSGGWEVNVHIEPIERDYTVRIENSSGEPLSEDFQVSTDDSCSRNLVLVNFTQVR